MQPNKKWQLKKLVGTKHGKVKIIFLVLIWVMSGLDITTKGVGIEMICGISISWHTFDHLGISLIVRWLFHV